MKNYYVIILSLLCLGFLSACSKDDDSISTTSSILCGTWEEIDCKSYKDGQIVKDNWSKWCKWAFQKDGTLVRFSSSYRDFGTYEYNPNKNKIRLKYHVNNSGDEWEEDDTVEILELTETTLVWKEIYPDNEYDYQIYYLQKTTSEYDEQPDSEQDVNVSKMTIEERLLVGLWHCSSVDRDMILRSDGTCKTPTLPTTYQSGYDSGTYQYDSQTHELITTTDRFPIVIVRTLNEESLVIQSEEDGKKWSFYRETNYIDNQYKQLVVGTWQNTEDPTKRLTIDTKKYYVYEDTYYPSKYSSIPCISIKSPEGLALTATHLDCISLIIEKSSGSEVDYSGTYKRVNL